MRPYLTMATAMVVFWASYYWIVERIKDAWK